MLPFSAEQFFEVFGTYNTAIWPAPLVAYGLGLFATGFLLRPGAAADRLTLAILALMWFWTGIAYHWLHFAAINRAALLFGAAFVVQGAIFLAAAWRQRLTFGLVRSIQGTVGLALIVYAGVVYPVLGVMLGHAYPALPMFGVTPCPVTIFTFGCLLLTTRPVPWWMLAIPVLWSLVGGSAAFLLGVPQDWILLVSGAVSVFLLASARSARTSAP
jgi:hypothetical protein